MFRILFATAACVALVGCQTTSPEVRAAQNQASCQSYGFKPGTDGYAACMMQLDLNAQRQDDEKRQAFGAALSNMGAQMQANRPVTCNTYGSARGGYGTVHGSSTTTCY